MFTPSDSRVFAGHNLRMNREHCQAILKHIELITHFANGGDIGHQAPDCKGEMMPIHGAKGLGLGGLHKDGSTFYLMLKPRYKYNQRTKTMERVQRYFGSKINDDEVIRCAK